jgi:uncharacterized protein YbjQ (UPF0145 family)
MIYATTSTIEGREVEAYLGVVFGDAVLGVNVFKDLLGGLRDIVGGRSGTYERELGAARDTAMQNLTAQAQSLGADAILGIDMDYEVLGSGNGMLMVSASGTAVRLKPLAAGAAAGSSPGGSPWTRPGG